MALVVVLACGTAAAPVPKPAAPKKNATPGKADAAWLSARALCAFPLARDGIPRTGGQLADAMLGGWHGVFAFRHPERVVDLSGGRYPAVDSMTVDLTGAVAHPNRKGGKSPDPVPSAKSLAVRQFTMVAEPLVEGRAKINLKVTGTGVRFDLQHDRDGKPVLMLADAKEGTLHFDLTHDDLERLILTNARRQAASRAVTVRAVTLDLRSITPRSLTADLHLSTLVGFLPAGIRFTARVDIDDAMNARISGLRCEGDEIFGPLIVGLIRPGLSRYEGLSKPLVSFPAGNLRLRDVRVNAGDTVELTAAFGS